MSDKYKIVDYKDRIMTVNYPRTVSDAISVYNGQSLTDFMQNLYDMINRMHYLKESGRTVSSNFPDNNGYLLSDVNPVVEKVHIYDDSGNYVETRDIITTRDHYGDINYPRTLAEAVIMPSGIDLNKQLADILKEVIALDELVNPLTIRNLLINGKNPLNVEIGSTISLLNFTWNYNKDVVKQTLSCSSLGISTDIDVSKFTYSSSEMDLDPALRTKYYAHSIDNIQIHSASQATYVFTLDAQSTYGGIAKGTATVNFYNYIYYGSHTVTNGGLEILPSLVKTLVPNRKMNVTTDAGTTKYIYIMVPARFGTPTFQVGELGPGGFMYIHALEITNSSGFKEIYNVYRSENYGLGLTTVKIS